VLSICCKIIVTTVTSVVLLELLLGDRICTCISLCCIVCWFVLTDKLGFAFRIVKADILGNVSVSFTLNTNSVVYF